MKSEFRRELAQLSFEEKIRMVGELIQLSRKVKASNDDVLPAPLDKAAADLDKGNGVPIARVRENVHEWAKKPKK